MKDEIKELVLLLLYLTSWQEDEGFMKLQRSWKGYPFSILNELSDSGLINGSTRSKSVCLTEEGIKRAKELAEKYIQTDQSVV